MVAIVIAVVVLICFLTYIGIHMNSVSSVVPFQHHGARLRAGRHARAHQQRVAHPRQGVVHAVNVHVVHAAAGHVRQRAGAGQRRVHAAVAVRRRGQRAARLQQQLAPLRREARQPALVEEEQLVRSQAKVACMRTDTGRVTCGEPTQPGAPCERPCSRGAGAQRRAVGLEESDRLAARRVGRHHVPGHGGGAGRDASRLLRQALQAAEALGLQLEERLAGRQADAIHALGVRGPQPRALPARQQQQRHPAGGQRPQRGGAPGGLLLAGCRAYSRVRLRAAGCAVGWRAWAGLARGRAPLRADAGSTAAAAPAVSATIRSL